MAESWTEERLDDLRHEVGKQGTRLERLEDRVDAGFRDLRQETDRRFDKVDGRFEAIDARFDALHGRLDAMYRLMLVFAASIFAAMATLVATQL